MNKSHDPDQVSMLTAEKAAQLATLSNDEIRLMAGEMTAQEMRSVQAVLGAVRSRIREAKPKHAAPKTPSRNLLASIVCSTTKGLDMLDAERIYASIRRELAIPAAPAKCVPVAWRMRKDAEADWHLTMSKPMPLNQDEATWEVQPLYASAPAAPAQAVPLTDEQMEAGMCSFDWGPVPHPFRTSVAFERGVRFAESHHGIAPKAAQPQEKT